MDNDTLTAVREKARKWLESPIDDSTRKAIEDLMANNEEELTESFYRDLEFGTGGLRGIMGVGTNRMNIYTVGMATQGLCNYLLKQFGDKRKISVVVAHDCRLNSPLFAKITAQICVANGIKAYLFEDLRPTPELSFSIRHLECQSGVMITASHNPREYNGYKVYWEDGGQIIHPHDRNIITEVQQIKSIGEVNFEGDEKQIIRLGEETDRLYIEEVARQSLNPGAVRANPDVKIVYTPIHGTGVKLVPMALNRMGFNQIFSVPEQDVVDGNFPTVESPNPEETAALDLALKKADEVGADLVMATDPDADRVGIAVRNKKGEMTLLNGNQMASLLTYYLLSQWSEKGKLSGKEFIAKTIVTTELMSEMARRYSVPCYDVLTGFKYIADLIRQKEGKETFIGGGEESYGFMIGDFVRDKDAVTSCAVLAEMAAWAGQRGKNLHDILIDIYHDFSFYLESLVNLVKKGKSGAEEIHKMMENFRNNPPDRIVEIKVAVIHDYLEGKSRELERNRENPIDLPRSNVLQFILEDGSKISIRPSGTEPKIKFYFGVSGKLDKREAYREVRSSLERKIEQMQQALNLK